MPQKLRPSYKFNTEQLEQLKQIVPEAFKGGMLDFNSLFDALSDYNEEDNLDMDDNFYGLYWPGKRKAKRAATIPPGGTLVPIKGDGVDEEKTKNIYIEGDNLEVLKLLQKSYAGKIKMIYIDPPYNTGNDFIYNDDFSETSEEFEKATGKIDEQGVKQTAKVNSRTDGRFHSKWLSMMYPRLKLAHRLLSDDGVIFISIDDNEVAQLRKICDEIFGEENFRNQIVVRRGSKSVQAQFDTWDKLGQDIEFILLYTRYANYRFPQQRKKLDEKKQGSWNNHWRGTDRPTMRYELFGQIPESGQWRWGKERSIKAIENYNKMLNDLNLTKDSISQEQIDLYYNNQSEEIDLLRLSKTGKPEHYIAPTDTTLLNSSWYDLLVGSSSEITEYFNTKVFDTAKLTTVVERMLHFCENDAIILDFFSGSSTTAHAVMQLNAEDGGNRKFIMVQLPEKCDEKSEAYKAGFKNICEIGKERIRRAGRNITESKKPAVNKQPLFTEKLIPPTIDIGFKVYRLAPSNYKKWKNYAGNDIKEAENLFAQYENPLVDNWKEEDLLTEIMLIEGFPLDSAVSVIKDFKKNKVTQISSEFCEHSLFVCLDNTINAETINTLALSEHDIFICLDNAVTDQDKARLDDKGLIKTI